jgi:hypothetical protein
MPDATTQLTQMRKMAQGSRTSALRRPFHVRVTMRCAIRPAARASMAARSASPACGTVPGDDVGAVSTRCAPGSTAGGRVRAPSSQRPSDRHRGSNQGAACCCTAAEPSPCLKRARPIVHPRGRAVCPRPARERRPCSMGRCSGPVVGRALHRTFPTKPIIFRPSWVWSRPAAACR